MPLAILRAPCKVNLFLRILGRRPDGYHELLTLFYPLPEPCDELSIEPLPPGAGCRIECGRPGLATDENLIAKAWRRFREATGAAPDVLVRLDKRIPVGAGLGGGSSDAAAMLSFLNARAGERALPEAGLSALAASLGADVPFFLLGRPALARGVGERLLPVELDLTGLCLVLVCPEVHVSTAWAYREWDRLFLGPGQGAGSGEGFLTSARMGARNSSSFSPLVLGNDFEAAVFPAYPELRGIKERLYRLGACGAALSGSGASVFGLFRGREKALTAVRELEAHEGGGARVFVRCC